MRFFLCRRDKLIHLDVCACESVYREDVVFVFYSIRVQPQ